MLDRLPVSVVSIYNYINPIIAVFLGWIFFREHFGAAGSVRDADYFRGRGAGEALFAATFSKAGSSLCGFVRTGSKRSPVRSKRSIALWMLNCAGSRSGFTSDQSSGVETGAPGCARRT